ncbi:hypothetical protein M1D68_16000 [Pseudomonas sp. R4-84]
MSQYDEPKRLAEDLVAKRELQIREDCSNEDYDAWHAAEIKFEEEVGPKVFLALIAENQQLTNNRDMWRGQCDRQSEMLRLAHDMETQLKAEVAGLKTGYQAYEQVNAELKAEVEALRNALRPLLAHWDDVRPGESLNVDAARAAMGQGEQS